MNVAPSLIRVLFLLHLVVFALTLREEEEEMEDDDSPLSRQKFYATSSPAPLDSRRTLVQCNRCGRQRIVFLEPDEPIRENCRGWIGRPHRSEPMSAT